VSATDNPDPTKPQPASTDGANDPGKAPETAALKKPDKLHPDKLHTVAFDANAADLWKRLRWGASLTDAAPLMQTTLLEPTAVPGSHDVGAPEKKPEIKPAVAEHDDATGKVAKLANGDITAKSVTGDLSFFANSATGTQTFIRRLADGHIDNRVSETVENGARAFGYDMMGPNGQLVANSHVGKLTGVETQAMTTSSLGLNFIQSAGSASELLTARAEGAVKPLGMLSADNSAGFGNSIASVMMDRRDNSLLFELNHEKFEVDSLRQILRKRDKQTGELREATDAEKQALHFQSLNGGGFTLAGMTVSSGNNKVTDALGNEVVRDPNGVLRVVVKDKDGRSLGTLLVDGVKSVATDFRTKAQYVADLTKHAFYALNDAGKQLFSFDLVGQRFVAGDPDHPDIVFGPNGTQLWNHTKIDNYGHVTLADGQSLTGPGTPAYEQVRSEAASNCALAAGLLSQVTGTSKDASLLLAIRNSIADLGSIIPSCAAVGNSQAEQQATNAYIHLQLAETRISSGESAA